MEQVQWGYIQEEDQVKESSEEVDGSNIIMFIPTNHQSRCKTWTCKNTRGRRKNGFSLQSPVIELSNEKRNNIS